MGEAPPRPKSPPRRPDPCGRCRLQLEVHLLNRELGFLQQEIQGLERIQPVSRSCKEWWATAQLLAHPGVFEHLYGAIG
ncbi:hypothetical protein ACP4OV_017770 [Aristida adscensionis]